MYDIKFKKLVEFAFQKSQELYRIEANKNKPNPYYIGFGNPNAKILILGKEKGFEPNNFEQLQYESIGNPSEWKHYIDNNILINQESFHQSSLYINAFRPYTGKMKSGHTWSKYNSLVTNFYPQIKKEQNEFLDYAFISEINFEPSRLSKIKKFNHPDRIDFLKSDYYKSFNVIICACGGYLTDEQIESIFDVKYEKDKSLPNEKFKIFRNGERILINTRQLSMNVSNNYLKRISEEALNPYYREK